MATAARHVARRRPTGSVPRAASVRPLRRPKQRRIPFALFAVAVVSVLVLGLTVAQALVAQGSFRIEELTRTTERLERGFAELRLEAAELAAPERIARWAHDSGLVLRDPDDVRVVVVQPGPARGVDDDPAARPVFATGGG